jgi:hypothetical protein
MLGLVVSSGFLVEFFGEICLGFEIQIRQAGKGST